MVTPALLVLLLLVLLAVVVMVASGSVAADNAEAKTGGAIGDRRREYAAYSDRMKNAGYDMSAYDAFVSKA